MARLKPKAYIEIFLKTSGYQFESEYKFHPVRRFRFDWAIPSLKVAIEYEGLFSRKSRHTTITGFTNDTVKYNLATTLGWRVLRYTAKNYMNLSNDLHAIALHESVE